MANNNNATPNTSSDSKDSRWYFTAEQLANSPSRRQGINADQELSYRQLTAYLIQEMGQRLSVSQLCINTAIVYMHRFYAFHSFTHFHRNGIAAASLFLAAKVEEQPRKLEHVIKVAHLCLSTEFPHASSEMYHEQAQDLVFNENVLLQTLGFDVAIDHPHTHVVKTCHLVKACKDLAQTSYFLASNSLHLTSMCLQYRPTVVACFCIYLACKWSRWEIPQSTEGKHWFHYVDTSVTLDLLKQLTDEFLAIYEKSPARLKSKLNSIKALAQSARMNEPQRPIADANGSNTQLPSESARRPESYSSHHRHHSSSGSHHNHHSKSQLSSADSSDHGKSTSSHKQPYPSSSGSSHSGRQSRPERSDRAQQLIPESQIHPPHGGSGKQPAALPGVQRPTNSNRPPPPHGVPMPPGTSGSSQRLPHTPHDPNYHKNRSSVSASINPAIVSGHKSLPKDPQRNLLKDPLGRPIDPNKIPSKHSSTSGMGSASNSSNPNLYPVASLNTGGVDLTRNPQPIAQHSLQRPFGQSSSNAQPPPYNQPLTNRSNNSSSIKYEQSVQQQMHLQLGQKQSLESSFSQQQTNPRQADESSNIKVEQMEICSPTKYPPSQQTSSSLTLQALPNNQAPPIAPVNKASSIFSPEWNDKVPSHSGLSSSLGMKTNDSLERPPGLGINIKNNRDSPKKSERDRRSETPKKEKNRPDQTLSDPNKILPPADKRSNSKKFSDSSNLQIVQNSSSILPAYDMKNQQALNLSGLKRTSETIGRMDDEREYKVRKVEPQSPQKMPGEQRQYQFDQSSALETSRSTKSAFSTTVNGIETDPDLVRNLLKESLCTENKFSIKSDNVLEYTDIKPIEPIRDMETLPVQLLQNESPVKEIVKEEPVAITIPAEVTDAASGDQYAKSKAEKKKKKDKHKHKEKDKSKDKEERKKHKKDKERSKERERSSGNEQEQNHVKLTIPKEKLNLTSLTANTTPLTTSELKIKIPKDRIRTDYQMDDNVSAMSQQPLAPPPQPSSLKIKISKDKIESYSHHSQHHSSSSYGGSGSTSHHSHHSSKKKDRDRDRDKDRDKDKKRSSNSSSDHNKQNGSGSGGMGNAGIQETSSAAAKSQSSNSSKMPNYSTNMSQLFGDLNDDDDSPSPPSPSSYQQSQIQHRYSHLDKYGNQYQHQIGNYYHNANKQ